MMRSLYSGVAGLKTHQTRMDVIGNNIANVNTTAFKSSTINFSDLMSQTTQNASGPNAATGTGGTNARQIGLGVKSAAIMMNIDGQGSAQSTGNPFDIMITGKNFFVVSNGTSNFFTRDGSFYVDGGGNLAMTSTGYNVMGWQVDPETMEIKQDTVSALRIMSDANLTYPPEATGKATVAGILDMNDPDVQSDSGKSMNLNIYDALGYPYTARFVIKNTDEDGLYSIELSKIIDQNGNTIKDGAGEDIDFSSLFGTNATVSDKASIVFNSTGTYQWVDATTLKTPEGTISGLAGILNDAKTGFDSTKKVTFKPNGGTDTEITADEALEAIAKAYGQNADDFLKLMITSEHSSDPTQNKQVSMKDLLIEQLGGTPGTEGNNGETLASISAVSSPSDKKTIEMSGREINGAKITFDPSTGTFVDINGSNELSMDLSKIIANTDTNTSNFSDITIDFSGMSMFNNNGTSTVSATNGDAKGLQAGRKLGDMIGVSIQQNGMIYASYDNGQTKLLGQIATAAFANNSGLSKEGDNLYSSTMNSGEFDGIGVDVTASGGYMTTGVLEMSNVDLSQEFTTMITTQRGFQANSRIITVSDTLLEELTNLKR